MFKRVGIKSLIIAVGAIILIGAPVLAYTYRATYTVTDNTSGSTHAMLPIIALADNEWMADNGFMLSTALDTTVETLGGLAKPHLVTDNMTLTAIPVTIGSQTNLYFTTGNTPISAMHIIVGYSDTTSVGYIGVEDEDSIEFGDNFTIEMEGWVDTSSGNAFALDYDGTDDFVLYPTISLGTTYSAEAWFKSDVAINDAVLLGLSSSPFNAILNLQTTQNKLKSADDNEEVSVAYTAWDTDWHYFVVTRSGTAVSFYMDGAQVSANQTLATSGAVSVNSTGAKYNNGTTQILDGIIDEVRLSDSVRSSAEILANWNGGMGLPLEVDANTVALWHYDEGTGGTTYDETTNDYDGTITQAAWTADTFPYKRALAYKEDAFTMVVSNDRIVASITGGGTVTASGVSSGEHTIKTTAIILPGIYEDFTTYTEVDANNKLTVIATKATAVDVDRDEDVYLYKDFTADHFNALDIDFEMFMATTSLQDGWGGMAITNTVGSNDDFAATDISVHLTRQPVNNAIQLMRGSNVASDSYVCALDTLFYCTLGRAAGNNTANVTIFSDSGRTILLDTLSVAGFGATKYRYAYGFVNRSTGGSGQDFDGYIQNLDLKEKYLSLYIDGALKDSAVLTDNVTDNSDNWTFITNNSMPYADNITIWTGGNKELWFQPIDMIIGTTLPDRATSVANDGIIVWGANPYGVSALLGSLVSGSQPSPGVTPDDPTLDILPTVETSDWFIEPDVSGTLLTNPLRPFVTILSDTTTLTELQAWRLLALAFVLLVTVATARAVRGHHGITGVAAGASIGGAVTLTIFPLWALVFAIGAVIGGLISERSPSL